MLTFAQPVLSVPVCTYYVATCLMLAAIWNFPSPLYHSALSPPLLANLSSPFFSSSRISGIITVLYTKSCVSLVTYTQPANLVRMDGWDGMPAHMQRFGFHWIQLALHQSIAELDGLVPASGADYRHTQRYGSTEDR